MTTAHDDTTRRAWLLALVTSLATAAVGRADDEPVTKSALGPEDRAELDAVRDVGKKFGLDALAAVAPTEHYLGIGDAPEAFITEAIGLCEGLAEDYLGHFRKKGFELEDPLKRLTVVVLDDAKSFNDFTGEATPGVGGVYELQTNRLVIFDNRSGGRATAARANSVALFHEATHQLTFNTGLLDRRADVPLAISEGLAMYGETRRPNGRTRVGASNPERAAVLKSLRLKPDLWIGARKLIEDDQALTPDADDRDAPAVASAKQLAVQMAYTQSWLLVYTLMNSRERLPQFREYLAALRTQKPGSRRLDVANAKLGDLDQLDRDLRRAAVKLMGR